MRVFYVCAFVCYCGTRPGRVVLMRDINRGNYLCSLVNMCALAAGQVINTHLNTDKYMHLCKLIRVSADEPKSTYLFTCIYMYFVI